MKYGITKRQTDCLNFIKEYMVENKIAPSNEEIIAALGLSARSGAVRLLRGLEKRGHIVRAKHKARSIALVLDENDELLALRKIREAASEFMALQKEWRDAIALHGEEGARYTGISRKVNDAFKRLGDMVLPEEPTT